METQEIRQPIITVCGHVDHGKTSMLDKIRGTSIQEGEAGGITQKISFTKMQKETVLERAGEVLEKFKIPLEIPGFLFIDTPGHAAFTNLRKRGGSLADIAIVMIDINDGIKPQTAEVLQLLKANNTPFIIALNKIDNISGWKTSESLHSFESVEAQAINVKTVFEERYYTIVGALQSYGIDPELYYKISDFTKNIAVVPTSAQTGEGVSELLAMLAALSQKFLTEQMKVGESGKGVVLEVKKDKSMNYLECILYDGHLQANDEIVIAGFDNAVITKVRTIEEAKPLNRGYANVDRVVAASGLRLQITSKDEILSGMPFSVVTKKHSAEELIEQFTHELDEEIVMDEEGIYVKADSLGSLEALLVLLRQNGIQVLKSGIGPITKKDIYNASALPEEDRIILGFNVNVSEPEIALETKTLKILTDEVVYKLIENFEEWRSVKQKEIERKKLAELPTICKFTILDFVFRKSNPAVFGVKINGGVLKKDLNFINSDDIKISTVREIQLDRKNVRFGESGQELAISMPGVNFERDLKVGESLYTNLGESHFRKFKEYKELLTSEEKSILQEIAQIKRRKNDTWGI
ncbi:MAG: translation initiation factor 5B [Patescibacteria group bacterium]|jgi:translation initiation factor 5B